MDFIKPRIADQFDNLMQANSPTLIKNVDIAIESLSTSQLWAVAQQQRIKSGRPWAPRSHAIFADAVKHFIKYIGDLPVAELRHRDVWDAVRREQRMSVSQRNMCLKHMGLIVRYFHRRGLLNWRPDVGDGLVHYPPPVHIPSLSDLDKVYTALLQLFPHRDPKTRKQCHKLKRKSLTSRSALVLQYFGGFRASAVLNLTFDNIYPGAIKMYVPKTGKLHIVPLHSVLERHLKRMCVQYSCHGHFWNEAMTRPHSQMTSTARKSKLFYGMTTADLNSSYMKACKKAKLGYAFSSHDVRRCSITEWTLIHPMCWKFIHGIGEAHQVMPYISQERLLSRFMYRLPIPQSWLTGEERRQKTMDREFWNSMFDVLSEEEKQAAITLIDR